MDRNTCYIVGAAPCSLAGLAPLPGDLLIAADAGLDACRAAGLSPDQIVGDFDSLGEVPTGANVTVLPVRKDETDTAHAVRMGLDAGFARFVLFGGMGGTRVDHTMANLALLASLVQRKKRATLVGDGWLVTGVSNGSLRFSPSHRGDVSVFSFSEVSTGVTEEGLQYALNNATLQNSVALGVSNAFTGSESRIAVAHGTLLVFYRGSFPEDLV